MAPPDAVCRGGPSADADETTSAVRAAEAREREAEQSVVAIREASAERLHALSEAADAAKAEADSLAAAKAEADALAAAERVAHERSAQRLFPAEKDRLEAVAN